MHVPSDCTKWLNGVTVSTLDSESSDRGPNLREAFSNRAEHMRGCIQSTGGTTRVHARFYG